MSNSGPIVNPPNSSTFVDVGDQISPTYLNGPVFASYRYAMAVMYDDLADGASLAVRARFPQTAPLDAFPWLSLDRAISQGFQESLPNYIARLQQWLDILPYEGHPTGMLLAMIGFVMTTKEAILLADSRVVAFLNPWDVALATLSSGQVLAWPNLGAGGGTWVPGTNAQVPGQGLGPVYSATALNGAPGLTFTTAGSTTLKLPIGTELNTSGRPNLNLFANVSRSTVAVSPTLVVVGSTVSFAYAEIAINSVHKPEGFYNDGTNQEAGNGSPALAPGVTAQVAVIVGSAGTTTRIDGAQTDTAFNAANAGLIVNQIVVGAQSDWFANNIIGEYFDGVIGAVLIVSGVLSPADISKFENFVAFPNSPLVRTVDDSSNWNTYAANANPIPLGAPTISKFESFVANPTSSSIAPAGYPPGYSNVPAPTYVAGGANWLWDTLSQPYGHTVPRWWRLWPILYSTSGVPFTTPNATWAPATGTVTVSVSPPAGGHPSFYSGSGGSGTASSQFNWDDGTCWDWAGSGQGTGPGPAQGEASSLTTIAKQWKGANVWVVYMIVCYDATMFDPAQPFGSSRLPDGTWGCWAKVVAASGSSPPYYAPSRPPSTECSFIAGSGEAGFGTAGTGRVYAPATTRINVA